MIRKRTLLLFAAIVASIFLVIGPKAEPVSAAASAANFHASNLEFWGGATNGNNQLDGTDIQICRSNDCLYSLKFDWTYDSIDPIVAGESFSVEFLRTKWTEEAPDQYYLSLQSNTQWKTVSDNNGNDIFQWRTNTNRTIEFKFLQGAAGKTSLSGSLQTARNIKASGSLITEPKQFEVKIGDSEPILVWMSKFARGGLDTTANGGQLWLSSSSDTYVTWRLYGSTALADFVYRNHPVQEGSTVPVLPKTSEIYDYMMELSFRDADTSFLTPTFYYAVPFVSDSGNRPSSQIPAITVSKNKTTGEPFYKEVKQSNGESYDDFKARLAENEWGYYKNAETGTTTFVAKFGDFPNNALTRDNLFDNTTTGYDSFEDWRDRFLTAEYRAMLQEAIDRIEDEDLYDGSNLFPYVTLRETATDRSLQSLRATATFSWTDGDGQTHSKTSSVERPLYQTPDSIVSEMGGLQISLNDATSHGKISSDAAFRLEHQNGSNWESHGDLQKNSNGLYAIAGLIPGETYRIVEESYPEHYQAGSLKLYSDSNYATEASNVFTAPSDSGTVLYATNKKQTFAVTFSAGNGQLASQYGTKTVEYGTATATIDPQQYLTPPVGMVFDRWSPSLAEIVTGNANYTAQYKNKTTNVRARVIWADANNVENDRPSSVIVSLYETINGSTTAYGVTKVANTSNSFIVEWPNMNTHSGGNEIEYSARVNDAGGYSYETRLTDDGYLTITGTYNPRVYIAVEKDWDDNSDALGARPADSEVVFHVFSDGVDTGESFTLADGQSAKFNAYSSLVDPIKKYNYTIQEDAVPGYDTLSIVKVSENSGVITYKVTNQKRTPAPVTSAPIVINVAPNEDSLDDDEQIEAKIVARNDSYPTPSNPTVNITKDTTEVDFGTMEFTEPGSYEYDINITGDEYADVGVDTPQITAIVDVTYDKDADKLVSTTRYTIDGEPVDPSDIDVIIRHLNPDPITENATFQLPTDEEIEDGAIRATVTPGDNSPMPAGTDGSLIVNVDPNGNITIGDIEFTEPGDYDYHIKLDSDEYDFDEGEFTIRVQVVLDESTNTLSVADIVAIDKDGNAIDLSKLKLGIARKAVNPNTLDKGGSIMMMFAGSVFAGAGLLAFTVRKRRR